MSYPLEQMLKTNSCSAKTKDGNLCRAAATDGGLCFFHANPKKASELGQIGRRKNRRRMVEMDPLPALASATGVRAAMERIFAEAYSGQLPPRTAAILGPLLNTLLRVIESTDYEERLKEIEHRLEEGLNQDDTAVPKLQERIKQLEQQLAEANNSSTSTARRENLLEGGTA